MGFADHILGLLQPTVLARVLYRNRTDSVNMYLKGNLLYWLTQHTLGSPTVAIGTVERMSYRLSPWGRVSQQAQSALKVCRIPEELLIFSPYGMPEKPGF